MKFNKIWFDNIIRPQLVDWLIRENTFHSDDKNVFLDRLEVRKGDIGSDIEFYSSGRISITVFNFKSGNVVMNIELDLEQEEEKAKAFQELQNLLKQ